VCQPGGLVRINQKEENVIDISIVGIDPGIIHTGCVALKINTVRRTIDVYYAVINGVDVKAVDSWIEKTVHPDALFIEDYNPGNYVREDKKMSEALGRLKAYYEPTPDGDDADLLIRYVDNAGVNTLIPRPVLDLFGVGKFPVTTHHNDLVSAGKIALLGMLKESEDYRHLVSWPVRAELDGDPWAVTQHA
jgi:hypothetical protein